MIYSRRRCCSVFCPPKDAVAVVAVGVVVTEAEDSD